MESVTDWLIIEIGCAECRWDEPLGALIDRVTGTLTEAKAHAAAACPRQIWGDAAWQDLSEGAIHHHGSGALYIVDAAAAP